MNRLIAASLVGTTLVLGSCGPQDRKVTRVDPGAVTDVDYRFNETDARMVWQGMSNDALFRNWIDTWMREHGGQRPIIIIGSIKNKTQDYVETGLFTRNFERELLNSGRVRVVAARDDRGEIRDERLQGQEWNRPETVKIMKNELGADLILLGDILDVQQRSVSGRTITKYYQVNLDLTDLESNEKAWIGSVEIKKVSQER